jgi:hypothetical protein
MVNVPKLKMPPPQPSAMLPDRVLLISSTEPPLEL